MPGFFWQVFLFLLMLHPVWWFLIMLFFISCSRETGNNAFFHSIAKDSVLHSFSRKTSVTANPFSDVSGNDTVTPGQKFLRYTLDNNGEVVVTWGKDKIQWSEIFGEPFGSYSPPWYLCEWKNYIGLRSGCGSPCRVLTVLPLKKNEEPVEYFNDILIDTNRNLVFHAENLGENIFMVYNLETKRKKRIDIILNNDYGYFMDAIDSASFTDRGLYVKWYDTTYELKEKHFLFDLD